jgi:hypothetical protein
MTTIGENGTSMAVKQVYEVIREITNGSQDGMIHVREASIGSHSSGTYLYHHRPLRAWSWPQTSRKQKNSTRLHLWQRAHITTFTSEDAQMLG